MNRIQALLALLFLLIVIPSALSTPPSLPPDTTLECNIVKSLVPTEWKKGYGNANHDWWYYEDKIKLRSNIPFPTFETLDALCTEDLTIIKEWLIGTTSSNKVLIQQINSTSIPELEAIKIMQSRGWIIEEKNGWIKIEKEVHSMNTDVLLPSIFQIILLLILALLIIILIILLLIFLIKKLKSKLTQKRIRSKLK